MAIFVLAILCFSGVTVADHTICQNQACKTLASQLQNSMDTKIKPCDNFYKYACGKWINKHKAGPSTASVWNHYTIGTKRIYIRLQDILKKPNKGDIESIMKAKQFHKACVNLDTSMKKKDDVGAIQNYIKGAGGWPITMSSDEWQKNKQSWRAVHSKLSGVIGASPIFTLTVDADPLPPRTNVPYVEPPTIGNEVPVPISEDPKDFLAEDAVAKYLKVIMDIAKIMEKRGSVVTDDQRKKDAQEIFMFEYNLRQSITDSSKVFDTTKISALQKLYDKGNGGKSQGKIDWLTFIREMFIQPKLSSVKIGGSDTLKLRDPFYFELLPSLLAETPERHIINTIHWWFIKQTLSYENTRISEVMEKYLKGAMKVPQPERWVECINVNPWKGAMGVAYIKKYFPKSSETKVKRMIKDIKSTMEEQIHKSKWIPDESSKRAAKEKLTAMIELVGGPDWYTDPAKADAYYKGLSISTSHFGNMLQGIKFIRQKELDLLKKPVDRQNWEYGPFTVNAAYRTVVNSITVPVGILQTPFFDANYPDIVNYARIGAIIGHEMSHGFDQDGNQYDKDGNERSLWSPDTRQKYVDQSKCFKNQFNDYHKDLGTRTLNENIADTTGVKMAFEAFKKQMTTSQYKDERLPGLDHLSPEKLFFLLYASSRCEDVDKNFLAAYRARSSHAPHDLQVRGALSNSKKFSAAFACSKNSHMNPLKKCNIW